MKQNYIKTNWVDGKTPITAEKLNKIENTIENLCTQTLSASDLVSNTGIKTETVEEDGDLKVQLSLNLEQGNGIKIEPSQEAKSFKISLNPNTYPLFEALNINKEDDYLYSINYTSLDYNFANKYFTSEYRGGQSYACTSVRNGNWFGRNLDFLYNNIVDFVVHTNAVQGRHKTIGIASCVPGFSKEKLESRDFNNLDWELIPFQVFDGINDCGVFANINVVPKPDIQPTTGTHPGASRTIYQAMLVRYILDYYSTAEEAVRDIAENINVIGTTDAVEEYEFHFMVGDKNRTYVLEFINNEAKVVEFKNELLRNKQTWGSLDNTSNIKLPIMTNFYLYGVQPNDDDTVYTPGSNIDDDSNPIKVNHITPNGSGLERYNIAVSHYPLIDSRKSMFDLLEDIKESKSYTRDTEPFWYSEFVGGGAYRDENNELVLINNGSTKEDFENAVSSNGENYLEKVINIFNHRDRNEDSAYYGTWHTTHSSVYDIEHKTVTIVTQENYGVQKTFSLDQNTPLLTTTETRSIDTVDKKIGSCYFDTTIGKPIWWSGSTWVDSNGDNV